MHDRSCYGRLHYVAHVHSQQLMWAGYSQVGGQTPNPKFCLALTDETLCRRIDNS